MGFLTTSKTKRNVLSRNFSTGHTNNFRISLPNLTGPYIFGSGTLSATGDVERAWGNWIPQ